MLAVLLATFNGEKYLREQLDSLESQTYTDFVVYIHDDGSCDGTQAIISSYVTQNPTKYVVLNDHLKHRGPKASFLWMLERITAEYYMFCDQDDIWLPDKISLSLAKIKELESMHGMIPIMVHTDLKVVDFQLNTIHDSLWELNDFCVDIHKSFNYACAYRNVFTGCTMIFNSALKPKVFPASPNSAMHDQWVGLIACKYGKIDNIPEKTILYRQHGSNVCSACSKTEKRRKSSIIKYLEFCLKKQPFLKDLGYGSILKFIWYNRTYPIRKMIYKHFGI